MTTKNDLHIPQSMVRLIAGSIHIYSTHDEIEKRAEAALKGGRKSPFFSALVKAIKKRHRDERRLAKKFNL